MGAAIMLGVASALRRILSMCGVLAWPFAAAAGCTLLVSAGPAVAHDKDKKSDRRNKSSYERSYSGSDSSKSDFERQAREFQRQQEEAERNAREATRDSEREMRRSMEEQQRAVYEDQRRALEEQQRRIEEEQRKAEQERERADREWRRAEERQQRRAGERKSTESASEGKGDGTSSSADSERRGWAKDVAREHGRVLAEKERQLKYDDARDARYRLQERERTERRQHESSLMAPDTQGAPLRGQRAPTKVDRAQAKPARPAAAYPGKDAGAEMPPNLFAAARREEFVVQDLSEAQIQSAREMGFELSEPVTLGQDGPSVQRLRAPGLSGVEAEREFHRGLPFASVTPNYAYGIFLGSLGESDAPSKKPTAASRLPCPKSVCFGGQAIHWNEAAGTCAKSAKIGIIDTSFDTAHPAFQKLKYERESFLDGAPPSPYDWHGTAVLSLLAGDPASGTPGLAPDATYYLASAFRSDAAGNASTDTLRLLSALAWLEKRDVDIVNMSFSGPQDPAVARVIERMSKRGIVFVAAAGNQGPIAPPSYPAAYPQVIAVTAVNRNGDNYPKANRGPHIDVSAPGVDILTALPRAQQGLRTGTSFAAPFVTAIIASQGEIPFHGVKSAVLGDVPTQDLGPPGRDPIYGAGLALASKTCRNRDEGATQSVSARDRIPSWVTGTTLMRAGAGP